MRSNIYNHLFEQQELVIGDHWRLNLHTSDPGESLTNTANYPGYSEIRIPRTRDNWTVNGRSVSNKLSLEFLECNDNTSEVITHASLSDANGNVWYCKAFDKPIPMSYLLAVRIKAGSLLIEEF